MTEAIDKPEALRLAYKLLGSWPSIPPLYPAAAELRRQHAEIDALRAEVARLGTEYRTASGLVHDMYSAATGRAGRLPKLGWLEDVVSAQTELRAEVARLRADAERYQWLTKDDEWIGDNWRCAENKWDGSDGKAGFDAAIDAARACAEG